VRFAHPTTPSCIDRSILTETLPHEASPSTNFLVKLRFCTLSNHFDPFLFNFQPLTPILDAFSNARTHPRTPPLIFGRDRPPPSPFYHFSPISNPIYPIFNRFYPFFDCQLPFRTHFRAPGPTLDHHCSHLAANAHPQLRFNTFSPILPYFSPILTISIRFHTFLVISTRSWALRDVPKPHNAPSLSFSPAHTYFLQSFTSFHLFPTFQAIFIRIPPILAVLTRSKALRDALEPHYASPDSFAPAADLFYPLLTFLTYFLPFFTLFYPFPVLLTRFRALQRIFDILPTFRRYLRSFPPIFKYLGSFSLIFTYSHLSSLIFAIFSIVNTSL
jgi:hypothetical protein